MAMNSFGKKVAQTPGNMLIEVGLTSINYLYCECGGSEINMPLPLSNFYSVEDTIYA